MKPPSRPYGHPSTITNPPRTCTGFRRATDYQHNRTGCYFELTPEQAEWLDKPKANPVPPHE